MTDTRNRKRDNLSQLVVARFYSIFEQEEKPFTVTQFCNMANITRQQFYKQKTDITAHYMDFSWLIPLIENGVDPVWLLTGKTKKRTTSR